MPSPKRRLLLLTACVSACFSPGVFADSTNCIDHDGDGWGWNGFASCIADQQPAQTDCIDSAPLNDGWGWDGVSSCRVTADIQEEGACIDSLPLGDGFGWNGSETCLISKLQ